MLGQYLGSFTTQRIFKHDRELKTRASILWQFPNDVYQPNARMIL